MKKPKIRFKGYQEDWEQRKLVDLVDRVTRKNQDLVSELPLTISAQYGLIDQNEFFDKRVASKDVSGYYLIENGEFAYNKSTSTDAPWGAIKRLDRYKNGVLSTLYIVFGIKENNPVDSDFLVSYYSTNLWHKGIHEIAAEGARNHGLLNIAPADFFETKLMIPQDIEEQKKIGKYFEELERLITLHHRKYMKYADLSVFDWEQRKFADFTWDAGKRNKEDLDLEPYAITNEHGFIRQRDAHDDFGYMKDTDRKAYNIVQPNSFAYNPARINVGSIGYYKGVENVIVSSLYEVFQTDNYVNDRFLWHWLKSDEFPRWIEKLQEGSVRLYFYYDKLCECQLYMPSLEEQEKIATFLDDLDHLITLHQRKCEETKTLKKYMLQKMFPQNGHSVPEIRFSGFTEDWEQRKLGELGSLKNGMNFSKEAMGIGFPFVNLQNIFGNNVIDVTNLGKAMASDSQLKDYNLLNGDVLFVRSSVKLEGVGEAALVPQNLENTTYSGFIIRFRDEYGLDNNFKRFLFGIESVRNQIMAQATNSANKNISQTVLENLCLKIPNKSEQEKIGLYFSNLDHLITLHQHKCEELQNIKKFMLKNMFI